VPTTRFVPSGIDAQSWIGFEQRIQERRFRALMEAITAASAKGDGLAARMALEEARELRPDAPELEELEGRVALLPAAMAAAAPIPYLWSRTASAVGLLLVGVALLVALDWARSGVPAPSAPQLEPIIMPASELRTVTADPAPVDANESIPAASPEPIEVESVGAVGTGGTRPTIVIDHTPPAIPPPTIQPVAVILEPEREITARNDVIDDFIVQPAPRPEPIAPAPPPPLRASRNALSSLIREPLPPVTPPAPAPAAAAPPAAAAIVPQDETRITSTLNQYARAYGQLDAEAAREVWPNVDERALSNAFAGLESQNVSFDDCAIEVHGATADASCRGRHSWLGKVGSRQLRTEAREWQFRLRLDGEAWKIESAQNR
jgi:hypothetical protein